MRSKARFTYAAGALAALAFVSGCSSDDSASSGANAGACSTFATEHNAFVGLVNAGPGSAEDIESWTADKQAAIDALSASPSDAEGDVASSMQTFVDALPADTLALSEADSESGQAFVDNGAAVASACEADGSAITLDELPRATFTN